MKIAKTIFNTTALVIAFIFLMKLEGNAQTVTYTAKNTATATGNIGPVNLTDISNNGATVVRDNYDQTPINFPMIGLSKTVGTPAIKANGSYDITYSFTITNFGAENLKTVQVTDDLTTVFASPLSYTVSAPTITGTIAANTSYNGGSDKNLLVAASSTLTAGATATITLVVNVVPNGTFGTFNNNAIATAVTDNIDLVAVSDGSTNHASPNHGDITKTPLDFDDPTPVTLLAPDIKITKTVDKPTPKVGENVTFTVTASNIGAGDAAPVSVTDLLPAGFSFVSATPSAGTYDSATGLWSGLGTIASGAQQTLTIVATVLPNNTVAQYTNTAANTQPGDSDPTNNSSSAVVTPVPQANLVVTNSDGKASYVPGTTNTYTVTVTNSGPSNAPGSTITYPFPTGVTGTWTAVYTGSATGNASGTGAINETANIPSGGSITYTITANVASNVTADPLSTTATAAVATGIVDTDPTNNTATDNDTFAPQVDLVVTNNDGKTTYTPGGINTYIVEVTNSGPSDALGSVITYPFPTGVTGSWTAVYTGGATGTPSGTGAINETANIPSGGKITYTITANVASNVTTDPLTTTATVAVATGYVDLTPANNTATDNDTFGPQADLVVTKTDGKVTHIPGTTNTYTIEVNNPGPADAPGSTVTDNLPAGATGTWTAVYTGSATGNPAGSGNLAEIVNLPKGGKVTYTYIVTIPSNFTGSFTNTATVAVPAGFTDPTPADNTAIDMDTFAPQADLVVTNTDLKTTYTPGTSNTYTVTVSNNGPSNADGSTITYPFPTGVTGSWTAVYAGGATGTASGTGAINETANIPSGGTITYTITANVASNVTVNPLSTTVTAAVATGYVDPTPANNTATDNDTPLPKPDLNVTNTDGKPTYTAGTTNTYTVVVTNAGVSDATGQTFTDVLPAGSTWTAVTTGTGTSIPALNGTGSINQTGINIAAGGTITYTITVPIASSTTGNFVNTATVSTPTGDITADNTATDTDTPSPSADLQVTKTTSATVPVVGNNIVFTITATNNGPSNATGINVTDLLKAGYTFVSATATTGSYVNSTGLWTIGNMVNGASATLTITAKVNADVVSPGYDNGATITGTEPDPNPANNTSTVTSTPTALIDLAITQTVSSLSPGTDGNVTFTLTVNNNGPSNATGVNVTDFLKAGFTFVGATPGQGTYNPATGIWTIGSLVNGASTSMTIVAKVNNTSTLVTDYTNTAVVAAAQQETTLANNSSVQVVNKPPTATDNNATTTLNVPVTIPIMADDIKGSSNLDPASIVIIQQPAHGTLTLDPTTGRVLYTPNTNYYGPDVFTYTVKGTDGSVSNVATVNITINDNPRIGIAKAVSSVEKAVNGSFNVTYLLTIGNYGIIDLNDISVKDDLSSTFRPEQIKVVNIKSLGTLNVNTAYDGNFNTEMLTAGNTLAPGVTQQIQVTVNVLLQSSGGITYNNTATASGKSVSGIVTTDVSTDGLKPDPNASGDVSSSAPTPVNLTKPQEFIPKGFSPNGDGVNDYFVIENSGFKHIDLEIYNRWGNMVYKSNNYLNDWDGRSNQGVRIGDQLPDGTYFYVVKVDSKDKYVGSLTLKR